MKKLLSGNKYLVRIGAVVLLAGVIVGVYAGFINKPQSFATETVTVGSVAEVVSATGKIHGEKEKVYYAEVSAPIAVMDLEVGDEIAAATHVETIVGLQRRDT